MSNGGHVTHELSAKLTEETFRAADGQKTKVTRSSRTVSFLMIFEFLHQRQIMIYLIISTGSVTMTLVLLLLFFLANKEKKPLLFHSQIKQQLDRLFGYQYMICDGLWLQGQQDRVGSSGNREFRSSGVSRYLD
eukprot:scaffold6806_cov177-Ochromonas_danica.AAC.1